MNKINFSELSEKIQEKLLAMDERQRYMIFGGILLFVFLLDYYLLMKPQLDTLYKVNSDISISGDELKKAKEDITKEGYYRKEIKRLQSEVKESNIKVKPKEAVPNILETLSLVADRNGVKIDQIMPQTEAQELLLENKDRNYYALPIFIQARSGFHDFGKFINQIENGDIFFNINTFSISSADDGRTHNILITLHAIVYENADQDKDEEG